MDSRLKLTLLQAIARQEGFNTPGTRAQRNHNPGNIRYGRFAKAHFAIGGDEAGYAIFGSDEDGFLALKILLEGPAYRDLTLGAALDRFAPAADGNCPAVYVNNVCEWTGAAPSTLISALI